MESCCTSAVISGYSKVATELAHEALSRVLRHYHGPRALQAPPATLDPIPSLEYSLVLAEVQLGRAQSPIAQLASRLQWSRERGMPRLQTQLLLALTEVAWLAGDVTQARQRLQEGLILPTLLLISLHTVKTCARRINSTLGVERRTQVVAHAKLPVYWVEGLVAGSNPIRQLTARVAASNRCAAGPFSSA